MSSNRFINERRSAWQRLEDLLTLLDRMSLRRLHREEVRELGRIYRRTSSDLAIARAESRSSFYLPRTKNFPQNTEVETQLTFTGDEPGRLVRDTVPTPQAITVREHHSFVALPDTSYTPRRLDPRVGVNGIEFYDYASAFTEPIEKRWINRHRLQKKDPAAAISEPVKPIIYFVDSGAPEPIRSALLEGASWWNEAFEAAGFKNAFQVKLLPPDADPMSLARIRQLAAHEVGHTLGLAHNFAASTYAGRASVMDYLAPMVEIKNGKLDFSNAYARGIGAYDKFAIRYAYVQFAPGADEAAELERLLEEGTTRGMLFISDNDARPPGAAHPLASLWDNGDDPIAMLRHEMEVCCIGLAQFGLANIPLGTPLSMLEAKLLPLYLHHRYQLQAAVKSVGGLYYTYAVKTATGADPTRVQGSSRPHVQREALNAVLDTLKPETLAIPRRHRTLPHAPRRAAQTDHTLAAAAGRPDWRRESPALSNY